MIATMLDPKKMANGAEEESMNWDLVILTLVPLYLSNWTDSGRALTIKSNCKYYLVIVRWQRRLTSY